MIPFFIRINGEYVNANFITVIEADTNRGATDPVRREEVIGSIVHIADYAAGSIATDQKPAEILAGIVREIEGRMGT